jgi:hypothetical protein
MRTQSEHLHGAQKRAHNKQPNASYCNLLKRPNPFLAPKPIEAFVNDDSQGISLARYVLSFLAKLLQGNYT